MPNLLVVDDDLSLREFLELMLVKEGYDVALAASGHEALEKADHQRFDLVITDIRMQPIDGLEVLKGIKTRHPETVVVLISAFATVETAVTAMKEGAYDFIPKPFEIEELKRVIKNALEHRTPEAERRVLQEKIKEGCQFGSLVGLSQSMLKVYDLIHRAAQTSTSILITGESGTGKELVARAVHDHSPRSKERFVAINCGGMPEQLIESELFGYRKGAFTGAATDKPGLFDQAHKGTIFLDEIGELTLPMQVKLLRSVQEKTFRPVGGTQEKLLDVRFIAATNRDLETEVIAGRFREDLYYRLNVINIHMPPLRERQGDIPLLAQFFLDKYGRIMNKDVHKISAYALDILSHYSFPGNVRELENIIERSVALEQSSIILPESLTLASFQRQRLKDTLHWSEPPQDTAESLSATPEPAPSASPQRTESWPIKLDEILLSLERVMLLEALAAVDGVRNRTVELLTITPQRLRRYLVKHNLVGLDLGQVRASAAGARLPLEIPDHLRPAWGPSGLNMDRVLLATEKYFLDRALAKSAGSKTEAARLLGLSRRMLHHRLSRTTWEEGS